MLQGPPLQSVPALKGTDSFFLWAPRSLFGLKVNSCLSLGHVLDNDDIMDLTSARLDFSTHYAKRLFRNLSLIKRLFAFKGIDTRIKWLPPLSILLLANTRWTKRRAMMQPFVTRKRKDGGFSYGVASHVLIAALLNFVMAYACTIDYTKSMRPILPFHYIYIY